MRELAPFREAAAEYDAPARETTEERGPAEENASADDERRPHRRGRRRGRGRERNRERRDEAPPREDAVVESEEEGSLEFRDEEGEDIRLEPPLEPASERDAESEGETRKTRGRRRRPRRGGSSRDRGAGRTGEAKPETHDEPTADESLDLRDAMEEEPDSDVEEGEEGEVRPGLRNIPTWDEAVGVMVSANLESRAKRPGNGESRGRGGRGGHGGRGSGGKRGGPRPSSGRRS